MNMNTYVNFSLPFNNQCRLPTSIKVPLTGECSFF
jgi:hypothetical protein